MRSMHDKIIGAGVANLFIERMKLEGWLPIKEYFKMKNHGLRRIFSLLLALFMVFTLLPTTALAEDTTGADETQPKTVVVDEGEKKTDPPRAGAA